MDIQILLNSGVFVFVAVRFNEQLMGSAKKWSLGLFLTSVFATNAALMYDRYGMYGAAFRSGLISLGFLAASVLLYRNHQKYKQAREET